MGKISTIPVGGESGGGVPVGGIILWSGAANAIPSGWRLCDGTGGTPDLRNRFVIGAGSSYAVGATGGEDKHTLSVNEMPQHTHYLNGSVEAITQEGGTYSGSTIFQTMASIGKWSYSSNGLRLNGNLNVMGGSQPHNNLPPYYALCYIMKIS